jgi:hypothetical protein
VYFCLERVRGLCNRSKTPLTRPSDAICCRTSGCRGAAVKAAAAPVDRQHKPSYPMCRAVTPVPRAPLPLAQGKERVAGVTEVDAPSSDAELASSSGDEVAAGPSGESEIDSEEERRRCVGGYSWGDT